MRASILTQAHPVPKSEDVPQCFGILLYTKVLGAYTKCSSKVIS